MGDSQEFILVSAPNKMGEAFIRQLCLHQAPFAVMVNNAREQDRMAEMGVKHFLRVDTAEQLNWHMPAFQVEKVFLFENSFNLCCRYIQMCRRWTLNPIYVITQTNNPRLVYRGLGATYVIHSNSDEIPFLIQTVVGDRPQDV
ncbi:hypothetical protein [Paenibacillus rigui]|uniref:Uncharacterized protein n=1 Tax=Paenibacillus rigui TaxID=554312 RepID=A0A229UJX8_9BACL|nr:hypothetical protein [Paenibacillus rigui]OXM83758.1 hypothetical protein CF651_24225 [Paenibacillus rigui]